MVKRKLGSGQATEPAGVRATLRDVALAAHTTPMTV
jgi:hypothetical protein